MDAATMASFEKTRNLSHQSVRSLCYAPFTNLFFDRLGDVRVCCWNWKVPVGNVLRDTMDEIWNGPGINELRAKLAGFELAKGCEFCEFQTADGVLGGAKMTQFDRFEVSGLDPFDFVVAQSIASHTGASMTRALLEAVRGALAPSGTAAVANRLDPPGEFPVLGYQFPVLRSRCQVSELRTTT